jgi:hypothetical protein
MNIIQGDLIMSQTQGNPERGAGYATPLWVKISGVIFVFVLIVLGIMLLGGHNPNRHSAPIEHMPATETQP